MWNKLLFYKLQTLTLSSNITLNINVFYTGYISSFLFDNGKPMFDFTGEKVVMKWMRENYVFNSR